MSQTDITLDVVSDVVCPWCYLGKRRLERALSRSDDRSVVVHWRPFRLDPTIPAEGISRDEYLTQKFGGAEAVAESHQRLTEMGAEEGITYRFEQITRSPNTVDAHRLIRWADTEERQEAMVERLFAAYFSDGLDIGDRAVLAVLADEVGVGGGDIATRLASNEDQDMIAAEIDNAYRIGVTGVPCFIIDSRYAVIGAQPPEVLLQAMDEATSPPPVAN